LARGGSSSPDLFTFVGQGLRSKLTLLEVKKIERLAEKVNIITTVVTVWV